MGREAIHVAAQMGHTGMQVKTLLSFSSVAPFLHLCVTFYVVNKIKCSKRFGGQIY